MEKEIQQKESESRNGQVKPEETGRFKINFAIYLGVFLVFAAIVLVTGVLGSVFGKTVENIALVVIAAVLLVLLIQSKRS